MREQAPRFTPPADLADRIRFRLAAEAGRAAPASPQRWTRLAASLLLTAALSSGITWELVSPAPGSRVAEEVVAGHVRSLMENHLTDVASTDQHTVKPWFNGRLALSPPVKDLTAEGYILVGGRLDYIAGESVAALVYRHRKHVINLYVLPAARAGERAPAEQHIKGFNVLRWSGGGLEFWAVSDLNAAELGEFEQLVRAPG
jgi:anti-sigma factor RsiW